jgi:hypothetical protein
MQSLKFFNVIGRTHYIDLQKLHYKQYDWIECYIWDNSFARQVGNIVDLYRMNWKIGIEDCNEGMNFENC